MANYALTTFTSENKQYQAVQAALEAAAEGVDTTKTIYLYNIVYRGSEDTFVGTLVYAT